MKRRLAGTAIAAVLVVALAGCSASEAPPPAAAVTPRHLVIVTIDTLRADRLGAYGNRTVPTPHFDRLAREGLLADDATTHAPITRPAHLSLFTGRYPAEHGIRDNLSVPLPANVPTLAERLSAAGFETAGFVSSFVVGTQSGLQRGFRHFDDSFEASGGDAALFLDSVQRRGDHTLDRVDAWLDARPADAAAKRTALWVHLYDPHDPYEPPEPMATTFADRPYDGEVAWTDTLLGRLRASLERRGIWNDALVIVTADHGEALGEHDETGHGFFAYETTLRVPLVMRGPGLPAGGRIPGTVRLVDLAPTALALLELDALPPGGAGHDVSARLTAGATAGPDTTYAESMTPLLHYQWSDLRVLREGPWKYILAPRPELYDLAADPGETRNLAEAQPARARQMRAALEPLLRAERERVTSTTDAAAALSADTLQKLGALGYVSPGAAAGTVAQGADPKDKLDEFRRLSGLMRDGLAKLHDRQFAAAAADLRALEQAGTGGFQVPYQLGRALVGMGRGRDAEAAFARAIAAQPDFADAYQALADAKVARRDVRGAIDTLHAGEKAAPTAARLADREGDLLRELGEHEPALEAYRRVMQLAPQDALARWRAGELLITLQRAPEALTLFREATVLDPQVGDYWNSLGMVLGGTGQMAEAADAFERAIARDARSARFTYNLGLVRLRQQRPEARALFERTLALDPSFRPARERLAELAR